MTMTTRFERLMAELNKAVTETHHFIYVAKEEVARYEKLRVEAGQKTVNPDAGLYDQTEMYTNLHALAVQRVNILQKELIKLEEAQTCLMMK